MNGQSKQQKKQIQTSNSTNTNISTQTHRQNKIVILYPQVRSEGVFDHAGCWDVVGYTGNSYFLKQGYQMASVSNMINAIVGQNYVR